MGICRVASYGSVRNFKRIEIKAVCPCLWCYIHITIALVKSELLFYGKIIGVIYLLVEVRLVAELRDSDAVTEKIHSLNLEVLEIVRVVRVTPRECGVRNEAHHH